MKKQLKSEIPINDDEGLEKEADEMGEKALEVGEDSDSENSNSSSQKANDISGDEVQLKAKENPSINAIQKVADRSKNVKQLNKLDTLANKRDRDGIRQLQNKQKVSKNTESETSVISSSSDSVSQTELEGQTNEI